MKILFHKLQSVSFLAALLLPYACTNAQNYPKTTDVKSLVYTQTELDQLIIKPECMGEYLPSQEGALRKPDGEELQEIVGIES